MVAGWMTHDRAAMVVSEFLGGASSMTTRILRERHRPVWRRKRALLAGGALVAALGLGGLAWHLGGAVPVHTIVVALPDTQVGPDTQVDDASSSGGIGR